MDWFQGLAESFLTNEQGRVYVLRVDIQSEDCAKFVDLVRRGKVLAVLARPPDDTWRPPARDGGASTQRLRDVEPPWGKSTLTPKHLSKPTQAASGKVGECFAPSILCALYA